MEAYLIDLSQISLLLSGKSPQVDNLLAQIQNKFPSAWELAWESDEISAGQSLESLLRTGKSKGARRLSGRALQLLCHELGEILNTESMSDSFMFVAEVFEGVPSEDYFYGRVPPPLKGWGGDFPVVGYLTAEEADQVLQAWPEPDHDDPVPEIYAAREQVEDWLSKSTKSKKTLIMFWG